MVTGFARTMQSLLDDSDLAGNMSARAAARQLHQADDIDRILDIYRSVLSPSVGATFTAAPAAQEKRRSDWLRRRLSV
jgi:hypothetical protein